MKRTEIFASATAYYGGDSTPHAAAFNVIMDQPNARASFEDIFRTGDLVAKLYALCAFQLLDATQAHAIAATLRKSKRRVVVQLGCVRSRLPIGMVVDTILHAGAGRELRDSRTRTYHYFHHFKRTICNSRQRTSVGTK